MTNALCVDSPREEEAWRHVVALAISRNVPLVPVIFDADPEEIARRVASVERMRRKLSDAKALLEMMSQARLQRPLVPERIDLDVTTSMPSEAALLIAARLEALSENLMPATMLHISMEV